MLPFFIPAAIRRHYELSCERNARRTHLSLASLAYAVLMALYAVLLGTETGHRIYGIGTVLLCLFDTVLVLRTHADHEKTFATGWLAAGSGFFSVLYIFSKQLEYVLP